MPRVVPLASINISRKSLMLIRSYWDIAGKINLDIAPQIIERLYNITTGSFRSMAPTLQAIEDFRAYGEAYFPRTVMSEDCRSWFNGGTKGGQILASWPGSGLHANIVRREPRLEDWEYTYHSKSSNKFAYFGNGWTLRDVETAKVQALKDAQADLTPYLQLDSITNELDLRAYHELWYNT